VVRINTFARAKRGCRRAGGNAKEALGNKNETPTPNQTVNGKLKRTWPKLEKSGGLVQKTRGGNGADKKKNRGGGEQL